MLRKASEIIKLCSFIAFRLILTEGRVYCQDSNASPWMPLGYSCPVNCHNVLYAIERLKLLDYHRLLSKDMVIRDNIGSSRQLFSIEAGMSHAHNITGQIDGGKRRAFNFVKKGGRPKYAKIKEMDREFTKLLLDKRVLKDLSTLTSVSSEDKCSLLLKKASIKPQLLKQILKKCSRRNNVEMEFLGHLTDVLNKYTEKIKFDVDMTKELLQKILGPNMDLRNGEFDIRKILAYLKAAVEHGAQPTGDGVRTLQLRSTHCLSAYVHGCFCKRGYVEDSGRCVPPVNCTTNSANYKYIARIIVY